MRNKPKLLILMLFLCISQLYPVSAENNEIMLYYSDFTKIITDGVVTPGEYPQTIEIYNYKNEFILAELSWAHNNTHLAIGIVAMLTGFIAFGMNGESYQGNAMTDANMIIASVDTDNVITIGDYHSVGQEQPIVDNDQYASLVSARGQQLPDKTHVEFTIPLTSDDTDDITWEVNKQYTFFMAGSKTSDVLGYHGKYHTSPYLFTILDDTNVVEENLITLKALSSASDIGIPYTEVLYVTIFFVGIIFFMRKNRLTARY